MKTFFTTLVMTLFLCANPLTAQIWEGNMAATFNGGTGSSEDPIQIANADQLAYLANLVNVPDSWENFSKGKYFKLTADLFLNDSLLANNDSLRTGSLLKWTPIGQDLPNGNHHFCGTFDGNGHVISGLYIDSIESFKGLFGYVEGACIQNLTIVNAYIRGGEYTGGLIGYARGSVIRNLTNRARVHGTTENTGGIIGLSESNAAVDSCANHGHVTSLAGAGGIAGRNFYGSVTNCLNSGLIEGNYRVGGIVGGNHANPSITRCINTGTIISGDDPSVGGIVGYNEGSLTDCTNKGRVTGSNNDANGENFVGGLVGRQAGVNTHTHCNNEGMVTYSNTSSTSNSCEASVGGIVGYSDNRTGLSECWNSGPITSQSGRNITGGIIGRGYHYETSTLTNCRNVGAIRQIDTNTANDDLAGGIVGFGRHITITNGENEASLVGAGYTGGIGGYIESSSLLECINRGGIEGRNFTGGISGATDGVSTVNCTNFGTIHTLADAGGIVGDNRNNAPITNSHNHGPINATYRVGGIAGSNGGGSPINGCINFADITSSNDPCIGGIAGSSASWVVDCKNLGKLTGRNNDNQGENTIGGIVGYQNNNGTISRCYNGNKLSFLADGNEGATAFSKLGGIVGMIQSRNCEIKDCSNEGELMNESTNTYMGGILGFSNFNPYDNNEVERLTNCSNSGKIVQVPQSTSNNGFIGGLVGAGHTLMQNCVNTGFIQGKNNVGVLMGANYNVYNTSVGVTHSYGLKTNTINTSWPLVFNNQGTLIDNAFFDKHQQLSAIITIDSTRYPSVKPILEKWIADHDTSLLEWIDYDDIISHTALPTLGAFHCAQPTLTVENGTLTIHSTSSNSTLLYTLDGSDPLLSSTAKTYDAPTTLTTYCPIKAVATSTVLAPSPTAALNYGLSVCEPPLISIDSCTITLSCSTPGALLSYTLDGSDPQKAGQLYTEPFNLFNATTIKAYAHKDSLYASEAVDTTFQHPLLWDGSMANSFAGGAGTESDPYLIATAPQLKRLSYYTYYYENWTSGKYFKLIDDIVLNTFPWPTYVVNGVNDLNVWEPIGNGDGSGLYDFKGVFDGDGHTVYGVYHDLPTAYYLGLFGATNGAIIKHVSVDEAYLHGYSYIGGLVGKAVSSTFTNVAFNGTVLADFDYSGGLTGHGTSLVIENGSSRGLLKGLSYNGGIAGYLDDAAISQCQSSDSIRGASNFTGGIAGYVTKTHLTNCVNTGAVYGENLYAAGIAGYSINGSINDCTNHGEVAVKNDGVGGIVGFNATNSPINRCTNYGSIYNYPENANWNNGAAGIVQINQSNISHCINHGSVTANTAASGIVASNDNINDSFTISNCSNYGKISAKEHSAGGILGQKKYDNYGSDHIRLDVVDCQNHGIINSVGNYVGGIIGNCYGGYPSETVRILHCLNDGSVKGNYCVGGLCGYYTSAYNKLTIQNSYNKGFIQGNTYLGGLVGYVASTDNANNGAISSCYNAGDIIANGINVGGLCGYIGRTSLSNTYNTGNVTASTTSGIGGLVGYMVDNSQLLNGYNTGKVSGETEDGITNGAIIGFIQNSCQVKYGHSLRNDSINLNLELYGVNEGTTAYLRGFDNDQLFEIGVQYNDSVYCDNLLSLLNTWSLYNESPDWIVTADNKGFPIIANFKCATPSITESDFYYSIVTTTPGATIYYTTDGSDPLHYGAVYNKPFTANQDGLIKTIALCEGYFNSELATYDCSLTGVLLGDANNDLAIRPSDVVTTVNYILGKDPSPFLFRAADINNNGEITTSDVVNIVRIILGTYTAGGANIAPLRSAALRSTNLPVLTLTSGELSKEGLASLSLSMENIDPYSAIQFDLELPEGLSLKDVVLNNDRFTASHVKAWNELSSNHIRIVVYSATNGVIGETAGSLLTLALSADQRAQTGTHTVTLDNIYLTDAMGRDVKPAPINSTLRVGETTGFDQPKQAFRIISGKHLMIVSPANMVVAIYTADGRIVRMVELSEGNNVITDLPKGIYLINKQKAVVR